MIDLIKSESRGNINHGWLDTHHTFSFAEYHNPDRMGFRALRVINEDIVAPGQGFGRHPHRDMEILTYIVSGQLAHRDNLDNTRTIGPGMIQRMTAGTGIVHAEFNPSDETPVHLLQIWLRPDAKGHTPSYEELDLGLQGINDELRLLASPLSGDGSVTWHQDARLFATRAAAPSTFNHGLTTDRHAWLQLITGQANLNGVEMLTGDGAAISELSELSIETGPNTEFLLFDLS